MLTVGLYFLTSIMENSHGELDKMASSPHQSHPSINKRAQLRCQLARQLEDSWNFEAANGELWQCVADLPKVGGLKLYLSHCVDACSVSQWQRRGKRQWKSHRNRLSHLSLNALPVFANGAVGFFFTPRKELI